jgi:hypothetical protein
MCVAEIVLCCVELDIPSLRQRYTYIIYDSVFPRPSAL